MREYTVREFGPDDYAALDYMSKEEVINSLENLEGSWMPGKPNAYYSKNELAVLDTFKLANPYEGMDPELLTELEDELGDLDEENGITCRRIKMPSGGALAFEVQGEDDDDVEYVKELQGVILFTHRVNGYWSKALGDGESGAAPDCSSMDGKTGVNTATGECIKPCGTWACPPWAWPGRRISKQSRPQPWTA